MNVILTGKVTDIFPSEIFGNFEKRVAWILEMDVQYPNHYSIEFHQGDANLLDSIVPGDVVKCSVDVRGRRFEKNGKAGVINTLKCWRIERANQSDRPAPSTRQQTGGIPHQNKPQGQSKGQEPISDVDDLPF